MTIQGLRCHREHSEELRQHASQLLMRLKVSEPAIFQLDHLS